MKLTPEQEGFEKFAYDNLLNTTMSANGLVFLNHTTQAAWQAWQARGVWQPPQVADTDMPKFTEGLTAYSLRDETANWQVVFKMRDGKDWGRLTQRGSLTKESVLQWATQFCLANDLAGAHIERW